MAYIELHRKECKHFLKNEFVDVHVFLDQYANLFLPSLFLDYHRTFLHNSYGLQIVLSKWGVEGYKAAVIHLTRDYVGATIDHWTYARIENEIFPRALMWFNKLITEYSPKPHVIRNWDRISLVAQATL